MKLVELKVHIKNFRRIFEPVLGNNKLIHSDNQYTNIREMDD